MTATIDLSWNTVNHQAAQVAAEIHEAFPIQKNIKIYGIPRGGIPASLAVMYHLRARRPDLHCDMADNALVADVIIDDIVDSGKTRERVRLMFPNTPFFALFDKKKEGTELWITFPWERTEGTVENNITRILQYIGEDPKREGLLETPTRVVKSYAEIFGGYKEDPAAVMKVFEDGSCDEMVLLKNIEFYSNCEHHMQPFFGKAHIAYIPDGKVLGVSKLARVLDIYARRLQIQERLTQQVTDALMKHLEPKGAACVIEAKHFCMVCRGVQKQNSEMLTSSLKGSFLDPAVRSEFYSLIGK